jgi:predicted ribosome quality control (RQC) complex YloA/Tae2 family protein
LSLNWKEIDCILAEIPLAGSLVRDIRQPSHPRLVLELYNRGRSFRLLLCFSNPHCRLHLLTRRLPKAAKTQRFVAFLRAHIRGGKVESAEQIGSERIVRFEISKAGKIVLLWARLWAAAANLIVTDAQGTVLDALYRRPKRGEVSGGHYAPEQDIGPRPGTSPEPGAGMPPGTTDGTSPEPDRQADRYSIRDFPGPGSFNERVERHYFRLEERQEAGRLQSSLLARLQRRENSLQASINGLERRRLEYGGFETFKHWADLVLSNLHLVSKGDRWLSLGPDQGAESRIDIELDPELSPAQNAESYYRRYRKAKSGLKSLEEEIGQQRAQLERVQRKLEKLAVQNDLERLREQAREEPGPRREEAKERAPGLSFSSGRFRILVGRNARENEELLRRFVRGNDTWLHVRDYPGSYVFVRSLPGKSIPLETLLDAASLALEYSKGRQSGQGEVYYTQVKYLKRVKEGKAGLVIPTQEKNLHVRLDPRRLRRLHRGEGGPGV